MNARQATTESGRPLSARSIRAHAGRRAREAVEALAEVAADAAAPAGDRVRAAELLLSHATPPSGATMVLREQ